MAGREIISPPALRTAFTETAKDPEFRAEADRLKLEVNAVPGEALQKIVQEIYQTPKDIVKKTGALLQPDDQKK